MGRTARRGRWLLAFVLCSGLVAGGTTAQAARKARPVVGVSMHFMADDYAKNFASTVKAQGKKLGLDVQVASADGDPQKQASDIQGFVSKKVALLIVIPIDEAAIVPSLKAAAAAKIPIVAASPVPAAKKYITAVVGPSDFGNGRAACALMVKTMKKNGNGMTVAISTASVKLYRIEQRELGCRAALKAAGAKVIDVQKGLSPEEGLKNAQNVLSAHSDLDGIFGSFSNLVIGAGNALKLANRKDVAVSGIDADKAIIALIKQGYVTDVAAQFPKQQATLIAKVAKDVIDGKKVKADQQNLLPSRTVDKSNAGARCKEIWGSC